MIDRFAEALPFGATVRPNGQVHFRLWAPDQDAVSVAIDGRADLPMRRETDGWFAATAPGAAGLAYSFRLDDGTFISVAQPWLARPSLVRNGHLRGSRRRVARFSGRQAATATLAGTWRNGR